MSDGTASRASAGGLLPRVTRGADTLARGAAVALLLGVPTSIALVNIALLFLLLGWLAGGRWGAKWDVVRANPISLPAALLTVWIAVGALYTPADPAVVKAHFYVYSKLPLMLVLLTLLDEPRWRARAWWAFAVGSLITLVSTYANVWVQVPWSDSHQQGLGESHHVFNDYIAQGLATAVFVAWLVARAWATENARWRAGLIAVAALAVFSVTHLLAGRTGQVVLIALALAVIAVAVPVRRWWRPLLGLVAVVAVVVVTSPLIRERTGEVLDQARQYEQAGVVSTSTGARLDMWRHALDMAAQSPVWGHGTGGYRALASQVYTDPVQCAISCIHPHNQYLFFLVDHGAIGLALYVWLLLAVASAWRGRAVSERVLAAGFLAVLVVDGFINGPFWVTTERHLFASVLPLVMAGWAAHRAGARP